jgi:hypothetical protein
MTQEKNRLARKTRQAARRLQRSIASRAARPYDSRIRHQ